MVAWPIRGLISLAFILRLRLSSDPDQITLIRKLSKINHPITSRTLVRMLREDISHIKGSILNALIAKPRINSLEPLVEILESGEYFLARRACAALGALGDPRAVEPIREFIFRDGPDSNDRAACAGILGNFGEEALEALHACLASPESAIQIEALSSLEKIASPRSIPHLMELRHHPNQTIRAKAASALGSLGGTAVPHLTPLLKEDDPEVVRFGVRALGEAGAQQAADQILPLVSHSDDHLRRSAVLALARIGNPDTLDTLLDLMTSSDVFARTLITGHMWQFEDQRVVEALLNALDDPDSQVRANAAYDLGRMKENSAVERLIEMLEDPQWMPRWFAFHALALIGDERAIDPLIEKLDDKDHGEHARKALILFGKKALKPLGEARMALDRKEDRKLHRLISDLRIDCRLYADRQEIAAKNQFRIPDTEKEHGS
jgi:HEAT repeat protein